MSNKNKSQARNLPCFIYFAGALASVVAGIIGITLLISFARDYIPLIFSALLFDNDFWLAHLVSTMITIGGLLISAALYCLVKHESTSLIAGVIMLIATLVVHIFLVHNVYEAFTISSEWSALQDTVYNMYMASYWLAVFALGAGFWVFAVGVGVETE